MEPESQSLAVRLVYCALTCHHLWRLALLEPCFDQLLLSLQNNSPFRALVLSSNQRYFCRNLAHVLHYLLESQNISLCPWNHPAYIIFNNYSNFGKDNFQVTNQTFFFGKGDRIFLTRIYL